MANTQESPFKFMSVYIHNLLDEAGFSEISQTMRDQYVPQFVAEAERRLGLALMPKLNEESAKELVKLAESDASPGELKDFWIKNVPEFDEIVKKTLDDFSVQFKQIISTMK